MDKDTNIKIADLEFNIQALKYIMDNAKSDDKLTPFYNIVLSVYKDLDINIKELNKLL